MSGGRMCFARMPKANASRMSLLKGKIAPLILIVFLLLLPDEIQKEKQ